MTWDEWYIELYEHNIKLENYENYEDENDSQEYYEEKIRLANSD